MRAKVLFGAGVLSLGHGDLLRSTRYLEEALAMYRRLGDQAGTAATVATLGYLRRAQGDEERAEELSEEGLRSSRLLAVSLYERALALHRELGNERGISRALERLGARG